MNSSKQIILLDNDSEEEITRKFSEDFYVHHNPSYVTGYDSDDNRKLTTYDESDVEEDLEKHKKIYVDKSE